MKEKNCKLNDSSIDCEISFRDILNFLVLKNNSTHNNDDKKLPKIIDTVFFRTSERWDLDEYDPYNGQIDSIQYQNQELPFTISSHNDSILDWFYNSSHGLCRHKNPSSVPLQKVYERFSSIVNVHNEIGDKALAIGLEAPPLSCDSSRNSSMRKCSAISNEDFLHGIDLSTQDKSFFKVFSKFSAIQPYIKNRDLENNICAYRVSLHSVDELTSAIQDGCQTNYFQKKRCNTDYSDNQSFYTVDIFILRDRIDHPTLLENSAGASDEARFLSSTLERLVLSESSSYSLRTLLQEKTMTLVEHIDIAARKQLTKEYGHNKSPQAIDLKVTSIVIDYVLDKNNIVWVSNISNTRIGYNYACVPISCFPANTAAPYDGKRATRASTQSIAEISNEPQKVASSIQGISENRDTKIRISMAKECVQGKKSARSLESRIMNLEVALANERKKNLDCESVIGDLKYYRDKINGKLQKLEIILDGLNVSWNKDGSETLPVESESLNVKSFLDRLEGILIQLGQSLPFAQESRRTQIVSSILSKKIHTVDICSEFKYFISAVFWIVRRRYLLRKYFVFKNWQVYTSRECEKSIVGDYYAVGFNQMHITEFSPTHPLKCIEVEDAVIDQEGNRQGPHEERIHDSDKNKGIDIGDISDDEKILNRKHRVAINRLLEMHRRDLDRIESMVENKVKLAVKRTEEASQRHHSTILSDLEISYTAKEEIMMQHLNKVHNQELNALKAQHAQQILETSVKCEERESILRLEYNNDLQTKINEVKVIDQLELERVLCAALRACDERWNIKVEAQAEEHAAALRTLEEKHRSIIQENIDLLMENMNRNNLLREAELKEEYSVQIKSSIENERNIHLIETQSLQEKYERLLQESDLKMKEYGEAQYQKGLFENGEVYRVNLEKLKDSANEALEDVKDVAKAQLQDFWRLEFMKRGIDPEQNSDASDMENKSRIVGDSCTVTIKARQEGIIDGTLEKLYNFKEIVWKEMMHKFKHAITTPWTEPEGRINNDAAVVKQVIAYFDKQFDELRTHVHREITECTTIASEYEEWIERLEYETSLLRAQKEHEERCRVKVEGELCNYERSHHKDIAHWKQIALQSSIDKWFLVSRGFSRINKMRDDAYTSEHKHAHILRSAIDDFNDHKGEMSSRIESLENAVSSLRERAMSIRDCILHYKREYFIQQKNRSDDLSLQLDTINAERQSLEVMRRQLSKQLLSLEENVNDVERRIRDHCKISAMQSGAVSEAHTGRKKRLDDEYDALVLTAVRKRNELKVIEEKIVIKTQSKEEIDNEMRRVERDLVGILLEQQKMILSLTT